MERLKIKGYEDFVKDPSTGAIINTNRQEYEAYMRQKALLSQRANQQKALSNKVESLETDINNIKSDINDIKSLLSSIASKL
jgi:trans-2-enoyl-CoA reductase